MIDGYLFVQTIYFASIVLCLIILFIFVRTFWLRRYLHKTHQHTVTAKKKENIMKQRSVINPISNIGNTRYRIYKLDDNLKFQKFFTYNSKKHTIFLKKESMNEKDKNSD